MGIPVGSCRGTRGVLTIVKLYVTVVGAVVVVITSLMLLLVPDPLLVKLLGHLTTLLAVLLLLVITGLSVTAWVIIESRWL